MAIRAGQQERESGRANDATAERSPDRRADGGAPWQDPVMPDDGPPLEVLAAAVIARLPQTQQASHSGRIQAAQRSSPGARAERRAVGAAGGGGRRRERKLARS